MARDRDLSRVCRTSKIFKSGFAQQVVLALGSSRGQVIAVAIVVGQSCMRLCGRDSFHIKCSSNLRRPLIFTAPPVTSNKKHSKNPLQTGQICPSRSRVCGLKIRGHKKRWPLTNGIGRFTEWDNVRDWYGLSYSRVETFFSTRFSKESQFKRKGCKFKVKGTTVTGNHPFLPEIPVLLWKVKGCWSHKFKSTKKKHKPKEMTQKK